MTVRMTESLFVGGDLQYTGALLPALTRSSLEQESLALYPIPWTAWRVWDAYHTNLPGTSAADDLALIGGTFGSGAPSIQTSDQKNNGGATSQYARAVIPLPAEYDDAADVVLRFNAGALTTVASVAMTLDVEVHELDNDATSSSDICTQAALSINNLTLAEKDFALTTTSLISGDCLDVRLHISIHDSGTGTVVKGLVGNAYLACDIKG